MTEETGNLYVEEAWKFFKPMVLKLSRFYISSKENKRLPNPAFLPSNHFQREVRNSLTIYKDWKKGQKEELSKRDMQGKKSKEK